MVYLAWSMRYGKIAPATRGRATGLEWKTASPPPTENFAQTPDRATRRPTTTPRPPQGDRPCLTRHADASLRHHFASLEQQKEASTLGMWVFIAQEIMFFGGLFLVYTVLPRTSTTPAFADAATT